MAKVKFRQSAIDDLESIWRYTSQQWSEEQADNYYKSIELSCTNIGKYPQLGRLYPRLDDTLRGLKSGKHIIFYQVMNHNEIEVIRILHERMDLKRRLSD